MRRESGRSKGLPGRVVALTILLGAPILAYLLVSLFLAVYLWFNPIVF
jgi:hypothetical protein